MRGGLAAAHKAHFMKCSGFAIAIGVLFVATQALAQTFPSHLVRIIVPFGAGGPADVTAR